VNAVAIALELVAGTLAELTYVALSKLGLRRAAVFMLYTVHVRIITSSLILFYERTENWDVVVDAAAKIVERIGNSEPAPGPCLYSHRIMHHLKKKGAPVDELFPECIGCLVQDIKEMR
jgi:hypothetical protein